MALGSFTSAIFFFVMWWIKELQVHPMRLFMYMMAIDSVLLFQFVVSLCTCRFKLHDMFATTVFFDTGCVH